jgi:hypothetical protein
MATPEGGKTVADDRSVTATANPQTARPIGADCSFVGEGWVFVPARADRADDYLYVSANGPIGFCVQDRSGRITSGSLETGKGIRIAGMPPFRIRIDAPALASVFFQGHKVNPPAAAGHWILESATIASAW